MKAADIEQREHERSSLGMRLTNEVVDTLKIEENVIHRFRSHGQGLMSLSIDTEENDVANIRAQVGSLGVGNLIVAEQNISSLRDDLLGRGLELVVMDDRTINFTSV